MTHETHKSLLRITRKEKQKQSKMKHRIAVQEEENLQQGWNLPCVHYYFLTQEPCLSHTNSGELKIQLRPQKEKLKGLEWPEEVSLKVGMWARSERVYFFGAPLSFSPVSQLPPNLIVSTSHTDSEPSFFLCHSMAPDQVCLPSSYQLLPGLHGVMDALLCFVLNPATEQTA